MLSIINSLIAIIINNLFPGLKNPGAYVLTSTPAPTITVDQQKIIPTVNIVRITATPKPTIDNGQLWGIAQQVSEHSWTMKIGQDEIMATPKEIMEALNEYRRTKGSGLLTWDEKLAKYAQERADYFNRVGDMDEHEGFRRFLEEENGFQKLNFNRLGENTSIGYKLSGVHLIEWVYAGDKPHDDNQLRKEWGWVGIGVNGTATCIIFGSR